MEKHAKSREHEIVVSAKQAKETSIETPMAVSIEGMGKDVLERIEKLLNTSYHIAKEELTLALFPSMIDLQSKNSLSKG